MHMLRIIPPTGCGEIILGLRQVMRDIQHPEERAFEHEVFRRIAQEGDDDLVPVTNMFNSDVNDESFGEGRLRQYDIVHQREPIYAEAAMF